MIEIFYKQCGDWIGIECANMWYVCQYVEFHGKKFARYLTSDGQWKGFNLKYFHTKAEAVTEAQKSLNVPVEPVTCLEYEELYRLEARQQKENADFVGEYSTQA